MKKFRRLYKKRVMRKLDTIYIPKESDYEEYEKNITIETKEEDGCKIEFVLDNGVLIGALCTDETLYIENQKLDIDDANFAYNDFEAWLNS